MWSLVKKKACEKFYVPYFARTAWDFLSVFRPVSPIVVWSQTRMYLIRIIAVLTLLTSLALPVQADDPVPSSAADKAAEKVTTPGEVDHGHGEEAKGLPKRAPLLFYGIGGDAKPDKVGPLAVTNSMQAFLKLSLDLPVWHWSNIQEKVRVSPCCVDKVANEIVSALIVVVCKIKPP